MSTLSGQSINSTYQGLLKLSNSTTGITSSFQSIEDGLGNNTGTKISTKGILAPNILNLPVVAANKVGVGISNTGTFAYANDEYDSIHWVPFFDFGINSYSGMYYSVSAITSTSDVVSIAFYNSQWDDNVGLIPYQLIATGGTLTTNSTGYKTLTLPSSLSFSGYGSGWYFLGYITTNSGTTPTVKFRSARWTEPINNFLRVFYGGYGPVGSVNNYVNAGITVSGPPTTNSITLAYWSGSTSTFVPTFDGVNLTSSYWYTANQVQLGFQLLANR